MATLQDEAYFSIWCKNFEGQLRKIYFTKVDFEGDKVDFTGMPWVDFCLLIYTEQPLAIDYSQN